MALALSRSQLGRALAPSTTIFLLLFLLLFLLVETNADEEWTAGRATYSAAAEQRDSTAAGAGACGYGDLGKAGYGMATAAVSQAVFQKGRICGACFQLRCVEDLRYCLPGTSIVLTAADFCPPNYAAADGGPDEISGSAIGYCNPPNRHFVMPVPAFEKIAIWKAGNMEIQYRRIKCRREGGIRFDVHGNGFFVSVLISNVAGAGDVTAVKIKGSRTGWLQMGRNWGQNWHVNADLNRQPLSFEVTASDGATVTAYNVAPKDWSFGRAYVGKQFEV